ncbi:hypothetical protein [Roseivirga ehrenbergii]|nr:hypothetical protein [Roseivirga ehrenbergii]
MDKISAFLNSTGFGFPESSDQIDQFRLTFKSFEFKADINKIDPTAILLASKKSTKEITGIDYHKRTVLAAEIVYQLHHEWSLGHVKLQKLMFLCQNSLGMAIHANFLKQAMGPYDPSLMRSIDSQFKKNEWFEFRRGSNQKYWPLAKSGGHKEWFEKYYKDKLIQINDLIGIFRKTKTSEIELIATIFACWKEILEEGNDFNSQLLHSKFYNWADEKKKFSESEINRAMEWMLEKGIYPVQASE